MIILLLGQKGVLHCILDMYNLKGLVPIINTLVIIGGTGEAPFKAGQVAPYKATHPLFWAGENFEKNF